MLNPNEYTKKREALLTRYEEAVREWLKTDDKYNIADKVPFFCDGVTCPEIWFQSNNEFRPLFILKEVSLGVDSINELDGFLKTWNEQTRFNFVECPFDDVKIGRFTLWKKIAALANGLENVYIKKSIREYDINAFEYIKGEEYKGKIDGYIKYGARTSNALYNDVINKIAVLEIKKIGGGRSVGSELSICTRHYIEHIAPFKDLIIEQIKLIDPTVIICCSKEFNTLGLLREIENQTNDVKWIYGCHPTFNSIEAFYYKPLREFYDIMN